MASKGQKFKKYTLAQKEEVLAKYIEGYSAKYEHRQTWTTERKRFN